MRIDERQQFIMDTLSARRKVTVDELATACGVAERTIRRDIESLTSFYPIETVRGRHGGGVKLLDWFTPTSRTLSPTQAGLLKRLASTLQGEDQMIMSSIITQFAPQYTRNTLV